MRLLYDYQIFAEQEFGGISRYICALASEVSRHPGVEARIFAPIHVNEYLRKMDNKIALGRHVRRLPGTARAIIALSSALFRPAARMIRPDIIHETYYAEKPTYRGKIPRVLTVYDMIQERYPSNTVAWYGVAERKRSAVNRVEHIFCISENTRRDLLDIHHLPDERVTVTYLGYDALPLSGLTAAELVGNSPFLLYVGSRHGYKNFSGLARAYATSNWLKENFRIVCFGGGAISPGEREMLSALGLSETHVVHIGGGDDRLAALYGGAAAFVYPSRYEGFGIPPLEAMSLGCPVICSRTSSIPEVVGDAGEYFAPDNDESIRHAIERVLQSSARRRELIGLGRARCEIFSWERCARETLDVYRRLAG